MFHCTSNKLIYISAYLTYLCLLDLFYGTNKGTDNHDFNDNTKYDDEQTETSLLLFALANAVVNTEIVYFRHFS